MKLCISCVNFVTTFSAHCTPVSKPSVNFISFSRRARSAPPRMAWRDTAQRSVVCTSDPASRGTAQAAGRGQQRPDPGQGYGDRYWAGATAGQPAPARGAAGRGRRQPAQARGDDAIRVASPGRRRRRATAIVSTIAAASAGSCVMPLRTLPRVLSCHGSKEKAHSQNLNAMARFHCSHLASLRNDELETSLLGSPPSLFPSPPSSLPPSPSLNPGSELLETRRLGILRAESLLVTPGGLGVRV